MAEKSLSLRLFIGIPLDEETKRRAAAVQTALKPYIERATWVPPENFHFTLKFLGDTSTAGLPNLHKVLRECASQYTPFHVVLAGCGVFPDWRRPRVLWIGVEHQPTLWKLATVIEEQLEPLGFVRDNRPYSPHLTLARIKFTRPPVIAKMREREIHKYSGTIGEFPVQDIILFESRLSPRGAEYFIMERYPLGNA